MNNLTFRPARGPEDAAALIAVHVACAAADGEEIPDAEEYAAELGRTPPEDWIIAQIEGEIVAYGHALWNWREADGTHVLLHLGWVKPKWRGKEIGTELLARLENRCREKADPNAAQWEYGANANQSETNAAALLTNNGYAVGYTFCEMSCPLNASLTDSPLPDGYDLRIVLPEHHRAIWQNIGDAYDVSRPGGRFSQIATEADFTRYFEAEDCDPALWFVAWRGSRIAGQCLCRIAGDTGTIYEVSVGFAHRRKNLASALLIRGMNALRERGASVARLGTVYENPTRAWRLYEKNGFHFVKKLPRWRKTLTL